MAFASVVVPAGSARLIDRCLDSLLGMDCEDFEIIVVTRPGLSYSHSDRRVRVIRTEWHRRSERKELRHTGFRR